ncbi:MAG: hypothetical protein JNM93_10705 [Bacteriovoracaceae bacterium]|nr:hypothetical protein [Bacteriovoracaceae bacterium]
MAYLLKTLLTLMVVAVALTAMTAMGLVDLSFGHIELAIPTFLYVMFIQAFVMFYFIGVARFVENIFTILSTQKNLDELFDVAPNDLEPYMKKVKRFHYQTSTSKRQTIPWTILMLVLGSFGFLLGGAHDTGVVSKTVHTGVIYSFMITMLIGYVRQWYYLSKSHQLLREIKALFSIPDGSM